MRVPVLVQEEGALCMLLGVSVLDGLKRMTTHSQVHLLPARTDLQLVQALAIRQVCAADVISHTHSQH